MGVVKARAKWCAARCALPIPCTFDDLVNEVDLVKLMDQMLGLLPFGTRFLLLHPGMETRETTTDVCSSLRTILRIAFVLAVCLSASLRPCAGKPFVSQPPDSFYAAHRNPLLFVQEIRFLSPIPHACPTIQEGFTTTTISPRCMCRQAGTDWSV